MTSVSATVTRHAGEREGAQSHLRTTSGLGHPPPRYPGDKSGTQRGRGLAQVPQTASGKSD